MRHYNGDAAKTSGYIGNRNSGCYVIYKAAPSNLKYEYAFHAPFLHSASLRIADTLFLPYTDSRH
jgi:hypothetical protein